MGERLSFAIDATQIDYKPILDKEFLELKMRAISSANPNRNGSWFTRESMEASIGSFKNKPILGYFENGDFVSHDGEWKTDQETDMTYWDTLGQKGERILGVIRAEDEVKIVEDEDGLSWVCLTCALWTQYSFKQVKKLLKDAIKAQKKGGNIAKNISVEVDITDYEYMSNGVLKINEFNLVGITILGSRNGRTVEPGIEDAGLSVVDIMGRDLYEKQTQGLRLAYEKLNSDPAQQVIKEEESKVLMNEDNSAVGATQTDPVTTDPVTEPTTTDANDANNTAAPDNSATFATDDTTATNAPDDNSPTTTDPVATDPVDGANNFAADNQSKDGEGKVCEKCGKNPCECEQHHDDFAQQGNTDPATDGTTTQTSEPQEPVHQNNCDCCDPEPQPDPIADLAWLISDCNWNIKSLSRSIEYYSESDVPGKEYVLAVLNRILAAQEGFEKELGELLGKLAAGISEEDMAYESKLAQYSDVADLIKKYESNVADYEKVVAEREEISSKLKVYVKQDFMKEAVELISSAELNDELTAKFTKDCEEGKYSDLATLKTEVAVAAFDLHKKVVKTNFAAPVMEVPTSTTDKAEKSGRVSSADVIKDYIAKK